MNAQTNSKISNLPFVEELSDQELEAVSGGLRDILVPINVSDNNVDANVLGIQAANDSVIPVLNKALNGLDLL